MTSERPDGSSAPASTPSDGVSVDALGPRLTADEYKVLPEILTSAEAARVLSSTPKQVARWAKMGLLPAGQIGRSWRFSKSALERITGEGAFRPEDEPSEGSVDDV